MDERARRSIRTLTPSHLRQDLENGASAPGFALPLDPRRSRARRFASRLSVVLQVAVFVSVIVIPAAAVARSAATQTPAASPDVSPEPPTADPAGTLSTRGAKKAPTATPKAQPEPSTTRSKPRVAPKTTITKPSITKKSTTKKSTTKTPTVVPATEAPSVSTASVGEPTIVSDKTDYAPGETVTLTGENWASAEVVHIVVNDTFGSSWNRDVNVTASDTGQITDAFSLPTWFVSNYNVVATGPISGTATTSFTDMSIGTYDQCSNDDGDGYATGNTGCRWVNGNLQHSNSTYHEGDATPQRLWLTGFTPNTNHTVTFQYGTTKAAKHAYDFLTRFDASEDWITLSDRCETITGCTSATLTDQSASIPHDPNVPAGFEVGTRAFVMRGGTFALVNPVSTPALVSGNYGSGDSETAVTVSFHVASSGAMCDTHGQTTTCGVAIWFGAHIADSDDWTGPGGDGFGGATTIPGSPYHVSLHAVDGNSAGERDNQMQAGAIVEPGTIIVEKQTLPDGAAGTFTFAGDAAGSIGDNGQITVIDLPPGTYASTESDPAPGFALTNIVCDDGASATPSTFNVGTRTATFKLDPGETVKCIFTNTAGASLDIDKTTVGGDASFDFDGSGTNVPTDLDITTVSGSGTIDDISFTGLQLGLKEVLENVPSGWTLTGISCTGDTEAIIGRYVSGVFGNGGTDGYDQGDNVIRVDVDAGETVNCVFTNTAGASLDIDKTTVGGDASFDFDGSGTNVPTDLDITTVSGSGTIDDISFTGLQLGLKEVLENVPSGWTLTGISCTGDTEAIIGRYVSGVFGNGGTDGYDQGDNVIRVDVDAGETVNCVFTNTKNASVKIVKDAIPNDAQDFDFDGSGSGISADFDLDDDGDETNALKRDVTFQISGLQLGAKTITESATTGWALTDITCTGDDDVVSYDLNAGTATITVDAGETIVCTYTNKKLPTIIVRKVTTGTAGGPFNFTSTGGNGLDAAFDITTATAGVPVPRSFPIGKNGIDQDFTVTESLPLPPGFVFTDVGCEITIAGAGTTTVGSVAATRTGTIDNLAAGATVVCTFVNSGALTTRTQGFWATHLSLVQAVWSPNPATVGGITTDGMTVAERTLCAGQQPLTVAQVMGGFWSSISKTTTGAKRSPLDQARMQLLQQLLAAILNNQLFGSTPSGMTIDQAKAAYCTGNLNAVKAAKAAMANFNESGDSGLFTPGSSADPKAGKAVADLVRWDVLP